MGQYLDPGNYKFFEATNSEIYVDKTGLISYCNTVIHTQQKYICVSRPRRFGKSMAANMLAAYYSCGCTSENLFRQYKISEYPAYLSYLNKMHVLFLNMQSFLSHSSNIEEMLCYLSEDILEEILANYPECQVSKRFPLQKALNYIVEKTGKRFVIIIDEWDCIFREYKEDKDAQEKYLDFLRDILKDQDYVALAYMTGILPIKKYGTHSALNMFTEYSMVESGKLAEYTGFTESEVKGLCHKYKMDFEETKEWYDGYRFRNVKAVYNPRSVVMAMLEQNFDNYWNQTESFEALKIYIDMNYDGLRDKIIQLLGNDAVQVNVGKFSNDMTTFHDADDVFTLMVHLGYLGYDSESKTVFIPNKEISNEFVNAIEVSDWEIVADAIRKSNDLLEATWDRKQTAVAEAIEEAHMETSHLTYNNENALAYTISLAYYSARQFYYIIREMPSGKGYADLVFIPKKKYKEKPIMVVELKWDKSPSGAIRQILDKKYPDSLKDKNTDILLVGINYNQKTRNHECQIVSHRLA